MEVFNINTMSRKPARRRRIRRRNNNNSQNIDKRGSSGIFKINLDISLLASIIIYSTNEAIDRNI